MENAHPLRLEDLAYATFEKPDLNRLSRFLVDFGMDVRRTASGALLGTGAGTTHHCYVARAGRESRFVGFGLVIASAEELARAAHRFDRPIEDVPADEGGGQRVSVTDPDGFVIDLLHGWAMVAPEAPAPAVPANTPFETPRLNTPRAVTPVSRRVHRLGHVVLDVVDFRRSLDWYRRNFGLIPSDVMELDDGAPAAAFMRFDRGDRPSDHHSIVLAANVAPGLNHCAFEMQDLEAVANGQQRLKAGGWKHAWGIGRHLIGSQVFDYWRDPWGHMLEHYADGDRFDAHQPTGTHRFDSAGLYQWGADLPRSFLDSKMTWRKIKSIAHHLRATPDFTLKRVLALKKAVTAPARSWL